ncbi:hypothetical protein RHGRI_020696 [Rhododendron griersonianum]|uniref:Transposase MuDR plant domain-containing protein n=1 Tax=Rhododendron griersonianum TaxID=479676 RepID=A0AAV6JHC4_9ERIC|nr:hypothetical protein RHGRI_020696 [Rhododendron griersonianum]
MSDAMFMFEVHHGGYFENVPTKKYSMGKVEFIRNVDKDLMSYFELISMIKDLGYLENCNIYHKLPDCDLDGGLRELKTDAEVWDMFAIHNDRETISIYVENAELNMVNDVVNLDSDIEKSEGNESESGADPNSPRGSIGSSDLEYFGDGDELYDLGDNISTKQVSETFEQVSEIFVGGSEPFSFNMGSGSGEGPSNLLPPDIQEVEDDDLNTPMNSDEEGKVEFPEFFEDRDMERPDLQKGMMFANATVFRAALRKHAIQNGTKFVFLKNEGDRVTVKCKNECGWRVHASFFQDTKAFQIKSLLNHPCQCPRVYKFGHANSAWLARTYMDRLVDDPHWKVSALRRAAKRDHMVEVSDSQAYKAKKRALETIEGNHRRQYWRLCDYCEMILRQNPGSTALLKVERTLHNTAPSFKGCLSHMMHK